MDKIPQKHGKVRDENLIGPLQGSYEKVHTLQWQRSLARWCHIASAKLRVYMHGGWHVKHSSMHLNSELKAKSDFLSMWKHCDCPYWVPLFQKVCHKPSCSYHYKSSNTSWLLTYLFSFTSVLNTKLLAPCCLIAWCHFTAPLHRQGRSSSLEIINSNTALRRGTNKLYMIQGWWWWKELQRKIEKDWKTVWMTRWISEGYVSFLTNILHCIMHIRKILLRILVTLSCLCHCN